jgi:hypothetical protein
MSGPWFANKMPRHGRKAIAEDGGRRNSHPKLNDYWQPEVYLSATVPRVAGFMNANGLIALVFVSCLLTLGAQERPAQFDASKTTLPQWRTPNWDELLEPKPVRLTLGKSDFVMSGALVETFRNTPRPAGERTLAQKFLSLPIVNMFVPGPMPKTGQGGKYFAWGERDESWSVVSARPASGPQGVLVSVSR